MYCKHTNTQTHTQKHTYIHDFIWQKYAPVCFQYFCLLCFADGHPERYILSVARCHNLYIFPYRHVRMAA